MLTPVYKLRSPHSPQTLGNLRLMELSDHHRASRGAALETCVHASALLYHREVYGGGA